MRSSARTGLLIRCGWIAVGALTAAAGLGALPFLWPPDHKSLPALVAGQIWVREAWAANALLVRDGAHWVGAARDFPPGSATHVQAPGARGFYLVRSAGGAFHAVPDRNPRTGRVLAWRDPLPRTREAGFMDLHCGYTWLAGAQPSMGAKWPLRPFAVTTDADHVYVAVRPSEPADCCRAMAPYLPST